MIALGNGNNANCDAAGPLTASRQSPTCAQRGALTVTNLELVVAARGTAPRQAPRQAPRPRGPTRAVARVGSPPCGGPLSPTGLTDCSACCREGNDPEDYSRLTYKKLLEEVCRFANVLKDHGVQKGDRVAIYMPMVLEVVIAMLACCRIGAVHAITVSLPCRDCGFKYWASRGALCLIVPRCFPPAVRRLFSRLARGAHHGLEEQGSADCRLRLARGEAHLPQGDL